MPRKLNEKDDISSTVNNNDDVNTDIQDIYKIIATNGDLTQPLAKSNFLSLEYAIVHTDLELMEFIIDTAIKQRLGLKQLLPKKYFDNKDFSTQTGTILAIEYFMKKNNNNNNNKKDTDKININMYDSNMKNSFMKEIMLVNKDDREVIHKNILLSNIFVSKQNVIGVKPNDNRAEVKDPNREVIYRLATQESLNLKEACLENLSEKYWDVNGVGSILCAKLNNRIKKNKTDTYVTILEKDNTRNFFIKLNDLASTKDYTFRFQVALYVSGHWLALDVQCKNNKLSFVYIDSVRGMRYDFQVLIRDWLQNIFKEVIKVKYVFNDIYLNNINLQKDSNSCSAFTIHHVLILQNTKNIHEELQTLNTKNLPEFKVYFNNLPLSLIKILRPIQEINALKLVSASIFQTTIKKNKQMESSNYSPVFQSIFDININQEMNNFIKYKKERFILLTKHYLQNVTDNDFARDMQAIKNLNVLLEIEKEYENIQKLQCKN